ncbi:hypothetical protein ACFWIA_04880 [Streptomyces sp. NPDC127068]|uniref:hypothetical protein n=1 Tax=Streptomyces sp. NPDC127068 TaxID=3347127 RepID=UPI00366690E2
METVILVAVVVLAIGIGMLLIHRLNAQHEERIAAHHFSDPLPRPPGQPEQPGGGPFGHEPAQAYLPGAQAAGAAPRRPTGRHPTHFEGNTPT